MRSQTTPVLLYALLVLAPKSSTLQFHAIASLHSFDADVKEFTGEATAADGQLANATGRLNIVTRSLDTHITRRDEEMFKLLEPEHFPTMTFTLKSTSALPNLTEDGRVIEDLAPGETKCALRGDLKLHGHTVSIEGRGHCKNQNASWSVEGEAPVDMTAFGITPPHVAFISMNPVVTVRYNLVFRPKSF